MLRLTWRAAGLPPRVLSQEAFLSEFESLAERNFAGLPAGPVLVEGLDAEHRLIWSGHYKSADELRALLRQLREERALMQAHDGLPEKRRGRPLRSWDLEAGSAGAGETHDVHDACSAQ